MPKIQTREGASRAYIHPVSGQEVPSVTTILKALAKPALVPWAAKLTAEWAVDNQAEWQPLPRDAAVQLIKSQHRNTSRNAMSAGTDAHEYAELLLRGDINAGDVLFGGGTLPARRVDALLDRLAPVPLGTELVCWSYAHGYAGSFDALLKIGSELWLADWKTNKGGAYPDMALQLAAYRYADVILFSNGTEVRMPDVDRTVVLSIPKEPDGEAAWFDMRTGPAEHEAFLGLLAAWQWLEQHSHDVIISKEVVK